MAGKTYTSTKSAAAREIAAELHAAGKQVHPRDVVKLLAARGILMNEAQCGRAIVKYYQRKQRKNCGIRYKTKIAVAEDRSLVVPKAAEHILLALKFAKDCGGIANARKAVDYLADFVAPVAR